MLTCPNIDVENSLGNDDSASAHGT
jgi:hypothetical protein